MMPRGRSWAKINGETVRFRATGIDLGPSDDEGLSDFWQEEASS